MSSRKSSSVNGVGERSPLLSNGSHVAVESSLHDVLGSGSVNVVTLPSSTVIEPPNQKRSRWRSIRVMYFTMFMSSVTFTMTMSTLWPYLQVVDSSATPSLLGWVVAGYSLGQLVASPLFGLWSARRRAREPLVVSLLLQVGANVFYAYMQSIPGDGGSYLIISRVLMGFASGNAAVVRAYVSGATTLAERTGAMSNVSLFQSVGFILGPVIQTLLVLIKYPGPVEERWFHFNMYTTPAFLAAALAAVNFVLLLTIFQLHTVQDTAHVNVAVNVDDEEDEEVENEKAKGGYDGPPDMVAILTSMFLFFIVFFMFTIFETIGTPLLMDMYGWSKSQAAFYMGLMLASAGILAIAVFIVVKILSNKGVDERKLLIAGYIFCFVGFFTYLPWGHDLPVIGYAPLYTAATPSSTPATTMAFSIPPWQQGRQPAWQHQEKQLPYHLQDLVHNMFADSPGGVELSGSVRHPKAASSEEKNSSAASKVQNSHASDLNEHRSGGTSNHDKSVMIRRRRNVKPGAVDSPGIQILDAVLPNTTEVLPTTVTTEEQHSSSPQTSTIHTEPTTTPTTTQETSPSSDTTAFSTAESNKTSATNITTTPTTQEASPSADTTVFSTAESNATTAITTPATNTTTNTTAAPEGCPWNFGWCGKIPRVELYQFILGTAFIAIGYPICNVMTYSLYSKVLGPQPQGLWMGFITACGSLARTLGPIFVAQIYDAFGPRVTFSASCAVLVVTVIVNCVSFRRLLPYSDSPYRKRKDRASSGDSEDSAALPSSGGLQ